MDLFEYDDKFEALARGIIERGFNQIEKDLNVLYKKSTDQMNWFYVGDAMSEDIADGVRQIADNFSNNQIPAKVSELLKRRTI